MKQQMSGDLTTRMERLERASRRWKLVGLMGLASIAAVVLMGQAAVPAVSDEVRTRKLVIVDDEGRPRAVLAAEKDGVTLSLADEAGTNRVVLGTSKEGAQLSLRDETGKTRARLGALRFEPALDLLDREARVQVNLTAHLAGSELCLRDPGGSAKAELMAVAAFGPRLRLGDDAEAGVFVSGRVDAPELWLHSRSTGSAAGLKAGKGGPSLSLRDAEGSRATLGSQAAEDLAPGTAPNPSAASLVLLDKEKNVVWKAP